MDAPFVLGPGRGFGRCPFHRGPYLAHILLDPAPLRGGVISVAFSDPLGPLIHTFCQQ